MNTVPTSCPWCKKELLPISGDNTPIGTYFHPYSVTTYYRSDGNEKDCLLAGWQLFPHDIPDWNRRDDNFTSYSSSTDKSNIDVYVDGGHVVVNINGEKLMNNFKPSVSGETSNVTLPKDVKPESDLRQQVTELQEEIEQLEKDVLYEYQSKQRALQILKRIKTALLPTFTDEHKGKYTLYMELPDVINTLVKDLNSIRIQRDFYEQEGLEYFESFFKDRINQRGSKEK